MRNFILGTFTGAVVVYFFFSPSIGKREKTESEVTTRKIPVAALPQIKSKPTSVKNEKFIADPIPKNSVTNLNTPIVAIEPQPRPEPNSKIIKNKIVISLSPQNIEDLEQAWSELPQQVEIRQEDRGWKITKLIPGSLFASIGLEEGDLITREDLLEYFRNEEENDLAARVINIFQHVSR
tara:strand:- start:54138 stop:54677 length:540 start_codon:yes stop_codon:yes gene_type:complete